MKERGGGPRPTKISATVSGHRDRDFVPQLISFVDDTCLMTCINRPLCARYWVVKFEEDAVWFDGEMLWGEWEIV